MVQDHSGHSQLPVYDLLNKVVDEVGVDDFLGRSRNDFFHDWLYEARAAVLPGATPPPKAVKTERRQLTRSDSGRREPSGFLSSRPPNPL